MQTADWVGLGLIAVVGVGGVVYFVKRRPLQPNAQANNGAPVQVVPQGQDFVPVQVQPRQGAATDGAKDAVAIIGAVGGLAQGLFGSGGVGSLWN